MRQDTPIGRTLSRYSACQYQCFFCGARFVTDTWFALHLYHEEGVRDRVIVDFLERDSDGHRIEWANRSSSPGNRPSASS